MQNAGALPRNTIAVFEDQRSAQQAVDRLSERRFPIAQLDIVADGIRFVEHVTGRRSYAQSGWSSATSGAFIGASLGFVFGIFSWVDPLISGLALAFYGLILGAVAGLVVGLLVQWSSGSSGKFTSVGTIEAKRYVLVAGTAELALQGRTMLAEHSAQTG